MKEFRESFCLVSSSTDGFRSGTFSIWCCRGNIATPSRWKDVDSGEFYLSFVCSTLIDVLLNFFLLDNYTMLCTIEADLSQAVVTHPQAKRKGNFYRVDIDIILLFGRTELKAQVAWKENVSDLAYLLFHPIDIG